MEPVKKSEAPDYYEIIRFPIGRWLCWGQDGEGGLQPPAPGVVAGGDTVLGAPGQSRREG